MKTILLLTACLLVGGCKPADPGLTYSGIDAGGAIALIDLAQTPSEQSVVLQKLENDRRAGFDWETFWRQMGEGRRAVKFTPAARDRLFALSKESCSGQGFNRFAVLVLKVNAGFNFVFGNARSCAQPLSAAVFHDYVVHFKPGPRADLAQLLLNQYGLEGESGKTATLNELRPAEWSPLIADLLETTQTAPAAHLVQALQEQFGGLSSVDRLIVSWLKHPVQMEALIAANDLHELVRIFTTDVQVRFLSDDVTAAEWSATLGRFEKKFTQESAQVMAHPERLASLLHTASLLTNLPLRAAHPPAFAEQLSWYEKILRNLESPLDGHPELLDAQSTEAPSAWLRFRLRRGFTDSERLLVDSAVGDTPLNEAVRWRLRLHASQTALGFHHDLARYCDWLADQGVARRPIPGASLRWSDLQTPGCVELTGLAQPTDKISLSMAGSATMAFDAALLSAGFNVRVGADRIDGSFMDLSTSLKYPALPVEPPPPADAAVTFPLLMGIRMHDPAFDQGVGTYFFVYHYTWRAAAPGRPADVPAHDGYAGADLEIEVNDLVASRPPHFASRGGPGQIAVPPRKGGDGSRSKLDWEVLKVEVGSRANNQDPSENPVALATPPVRILERLFTLGETGADHNLQLYIEPKLMWDSLDLEQRQKARLACPSGAADLVCWTTVTARAGVDLWRQYSAICPKAASGNRVCPTAQLDTQFDRLSSIYFEEPSGGLGPINSNGLIGPEGQLTLLTRAKDIP